MSEGVPVDQIEIVRVQGAQPWEWAVRKRSHWCTCCGYPLGGTKEAIRQAVRAVPGVRFCDVADGPTPGWVDVLVVDGADAEIVQAIDDVRYGGVAVRIVRAWPVEPSP